MKRNLFLFVSMIICSSFIFAMTTDTRKQIKMKIRQKIEHRSTDVPTPVRTFINLSSLEIEFEYPINDAIISIIESRTGVTVYYEKVTTFEKLKFIDLSEYDKNAEYILEVSTISWSTTGVFTLE